MAAALQTDPVYVAPARSERLGHRRDGTDPPGDPAQGHRPRSTSRSCPDRGRPKRAGRARLANEVDQELRGRGALLVVADNGVHVITSHDHATAAATGVQRAFDRGGSLEAKLRHSVEALADVDPGRRATSAARSAAPTVTVPGGFPDANRISKDVNDTIRFTVIAIILATLLPFVLVGVVLWLARAARREEDAEAFADALAAGATSERAALGDDIVDLDVPTSMPGVVAPTCAPPTSVRSTPTRRASRR